MNALMTTMPISFVLLFSPFRPGMGSIFPEPPSLKFPSTYLKQRRSVNG
jgi:hypothetical protein